jgi:predicted unusual protein kinase regulating ubiquinone biosynthesis (AarF/ABC1/UbiB family)
MTYWKSCSIHRMKSFIPWDAATRRGLTSQAQSYAPRNGSYRRRHELALKILQRLLIWSSAILYFQLGNWYDVIHDRDPLTAEAVRLRQTFERVGGTFVKIGQQMASRPDLLPQRYCEELPTCWIVIRRSRPNKPSLIERTTPETGADFRGVRPGANRLRVNRGCVPSACARTAPMVAVKVRRPGIRELFEADFRAPDFLGILAEMLTLVRPGYTGNIRSEFRAALTSELDFSREGRLGELFRRRTRKANKRHVTAPQVFFEYSNDDVLVQEFVSGMWMWEILAAIERSDPLGLARMQELNLDQAIARRLLHITTGASIQFSFHADPHPANIVVRQQRSGVSRFGASGYANNMRKVLFGAPESRTTGHDGAVRLNSASRCRCGGTR